MEESPARCGLSALHAGGVHDRAEALFWTNFGTPYLSRPESDLSDLYVVGETGSKIRGASSLSCYFLFFFIFLSVLVWAHIENVEELSGNGDRGDRERSGELEARRLTHRYFRRSLVAENVRWRTPENLKGWLFWNFIFWRELVPHVVLLVPKLDHCFSLKPCEAHHCLMDSHGKAPMPSEDVPVISVARGDLVDLRVNLAKPGAPPTSVTPPEAVDPWYSPSSDVFALNSVPASERAKASTINTPRELQELWGGRLAGYDGGDFVSPTLEKGWALLSPIGLLLALGGCWPPMSVSVSALKHLACVFFSLYKPVTRKAFVYFRAVGHYIIEALPNNPKAHCSEFFKVIPTPGKVPWWVREDDWRPLFTLKWLDLDFHPLPKETLLSEYKDSLQPEGDQTATPTSDQVGTPESDQAAAPASQIPYIPPGVASLQGANRSNKPTSWRDAARLAPDTFEVRRPVLEIPLQLASDAVIFRGSYYPLHSSEKEFVGRLFPEYLVSDYSMRTFALAAASMLGQVNQVALELADKREYGLIDWNRYREPPPVSEESSFASDSSSPSRGDAPGGESDNSGA
ncbi:uncharacterized protein G2W53_032843 [Senna tora]|uniref:Transmembrane protein n=1 Tax=Senna tora TaxID=362788 RepID=A0A834W7A5_9FABA|nr:uncharacterized protein G2W53_032843 [Senna tora]